MNWLEVKENNNKIFIYITSWFRGEETIFIFLILKLIKLFNLCII